MENSPVTSEFPAQMASNAEMLPFDDVIMRSYPHMAWMTPWNGMGLSMTWLENMAHSKPQPCMRFALTARR